MDHDTQDDTAADKNESISDEDTHLVKPCHGLQVLSVPLGGGTARFEL